MENCKDDQIEFFGGKFEFPGPRAYHKKSKMTRSKIRGNYDENGAYFR